jgi:hypothetical protein
MQTATSVIDWLLDSDPAIRWQAMRDLLDAQPHVVAGERSRVSTEGWGAQLLAMQGSDGIWRMPGEQADMVTVRAMGLLRDMGADPDSPAVERAVSTLRDSPQWLSLLPEGYAYHARPFFTGETEPCINGRVLSIGAYFGQDVRAVLERLLGEQMADGGWNCEQENGSIRGSFHSTINVLEGLLQYEMSGAGSADVAAARQGGEEYLLKRGLCRRLSDGEVIDPEFLQLSFPTGYHYDILRALEYFRSGGGSIDPRVAEAVDMVRAKRQADGTWSLENPHDDGFVMGFAEVEGQPSRWNTLRAMRVLRWYEGDGAGS